MDTYFPTSNTWTALDVTDVGVTRFLNMHLQGNLQMDDNRTIAFGDSGVADAYIKYVPDNLTFYDRTVGVAKTLSQLVSGGAVTIDGAFDNGKIIDGATSSANALQVGGTNDKILLYENANNDVRIGTTAGATLMITAESGTVSFNDDNITTSGTITAASDLALGSGSITSVTGAISFGNENLTTTGTINIASDNVNLTIGASGATDAYLYFDGAGNLMFYDSNLGVATSLTNLAGGSLTAPTVTDDLTITDGKITWTDLVDEVAGAFTFSNVANDSINIVANAMTTANLLHIASSSVNSGTLVLAESVDATMTTGYYFEAYNGAATVFGVKRYGEIEITGNAAADMLTISAGDVQIDNGKIEIDTVQDIQSYIIRNNATGTNAVFLVKEDHIAGGVALQVVSDHTGAVNAMEITHANAGAYGLSIIGSAVTGSQLLARGPASQTASSVVIDGSTNSWIGAATTGMLHLTSDGALANATASLIYSAHSGNAGGASLSGACLYAVETGAASGTSYAVGITSTNNNGLKISVGAVTKTNLVLEGVASQTAAIAMVDGVTNNWIGAANVGMIHFKSDGALAHADTSMLYGTYTGNTGVVVTNGAIAYFYENGTMAAGSYAVYIKSTGGNGLKIETAAAGVTGLTVLGAANTVSLVKIDGATGGAAWVGAATTGMLQLDSDGAIAADGSLLRIASSGQPAAANDGVCIEVVESGAAQATSYAVRITSTNNEALHVDAGESLFDERITIANGANLDVGGAVAARATPPTNAINLTNGTAPVGALANVVTLYAAAGELRVMDAGGNSTLLSPHDDADMWVFDSENAVTGKKVHIDMERLILALVEKFPDLGQYVTITQE